MAYRGRPYRIARKALESVGAKEYVHGFLSRLVSLRVAGDAQPISRMFEEDKRQYLAAVARQRNLQTFVETGTYLGKTTELLAGCCPRVFTIELDDLLHEAAAKKFADRAGVTVLHGDSADKLPVVLDQLNGPALFWLDGHYSGTGTGFGKQTSPIEAELRAIFAHPVKDHVIVVDDARLFSGRDGYPSLARVTHMVLHDSPYKIALTNDLIRIQREDI